MDLVLFWKGRYVLKERISRSKDFKGNNIGARKEKAGLLSCGWAGSLKRRLLKDKVRVQVPIPEERSRKEVEIFHD